MLKLNLSKLDTDCATVQGSEFAIESKEDGRVYLTSKPYIDKLFKLMGYKNLNVVKILEEYANKTVSDIGALEGHSLYVDEITDSFIIASDAAIEWTRKLYKELDKNGFKVLEVRHYDTYRIWDQVTLEAPTGTRYAMYLDLCGEKAYLLALAYKDNILVGIEDEGSYNCNEESDIDSMMTLMTNPVDISGNFMMDQKLSIYEYVNLLRTLGYVTKKKKNFYPTEESAEIDEYVGNLEAILDDYNSSSWLQQRIREVPNHAKFKDACELISINLGQVTFWNLKDFYIANARETSDFFALNY